METSNDNHADGAWESSTGAETLEWRLRATRMLDSESDHRLTAALDHEGVDFHQRGFASPWGDPNQDQSYDRSGYAAEYLGKPLDGFSWTANARLDRFSDFDDAFTWQLGAAHRLDSGIKLRASLGTGSKAPSFIERYGFYPDFFLGNPALKPETSSGWEAGVYLPLADHRFSLDFTWFDQELEDEIDGFVFDPQTLLFTARNKENASVRKGVEVIFEGQPVADLTFSVSYTYLDAYELDENGGRSREIRRPRHLATLALRYAFGAGRGHLNLTVNYNGGQLDNYYPPPTFLPEQVELDSYTLADLAVSWRLGKRWELTGRIENLLDEDYEEILGYARPGRAVHAGLRARFGP
jgi:vitamin B12 transporter